MAWQAHVDDRVEDHTGVSIPPSKHQGMWQTDVGHDTRSPVDHVWLFGGFSVVNQAP